MQLGVDLASVDGNHVVDFKSARAAGARFVYIRRSYAYFDAGHRAWAQLPDPTFARLAQLARDAGLVVGAYMFPGIGRNAPSPTAQVANFVRAGGSVGAGDLPVMLDVEFPGRGIQDTGLSQAEALEQVLAIVSELRGAYRAVGVYTSHVQWHDSNGLGGPAAPVLADTWLWQKTPYRRKARQPLDTTSPALPYSGSPPGWDPSEYFRTPLPWRGTGPWFQQYQGDCLGLPGFDATVDVNRFLALDTAVASASDPRRSRVAALLKVSDADLSAAVVDFQRSRGLAPDGVVGVSTLSQLCWL